jgi:phosphoribosyl-ATP pyrophosphohydrolase/phosphoribosyl-AMP cyclohydrolase
MLQLDALNFEKGGGLVTVVAVHARTGQVLMVAHADREALEKTLSTRQMHYRSRSRGLWHKGGTSGNVQHVISLAPDCDGDAVLARVEPAGPACHTGSPTCFGAEPAEAFGALDAVVAARASEPPEAPGERKSYTRKLLQDRNLRLKKLGEETAELVTALADADRERVVEEAADVIYHLTVALRAAGLSLDDVRAALDRRAAPTRPF